MNVKSPVSAANRLAQRRGYKEVGWETTPVDSGSTENLCAMAVGRETS